MTTATDPTTAGTDPTATATDPTTAGTDPMTTATDPTTAGTDPMTTATDPTTAGTDPTATATDPTTAGTDSTATATDPTETDPTTIGTQPTTIGTQPTTIGTQPTKDCINMTAIGTNLTAIGTNLTAIGTNLMAISTNLTEVGTNLTAMGANLLAVGTNLKAIGTNLTPNGTNPTAIGTNLTHDLSNLEGGTRYSIQVFPVKCGRSLNPQAATFYTIPNEVQNLSVTKVTETSVFLSWNKPSGHADLYQVKVNGSDHSKTTILTRSEVVGLKPGINHTFIVLSGLYSDSLRSEASHISGCTKPLRVSNLKVSGNTPHSLLLSWTPPEGYITGFQVQALNDTNDTLCEETVEGEWNRTRPEVKVTGLPIGTRITLSVVAIASGTVESDKATIVNYTAPAPISDLTLETTHSTLKATWKQPTGSYSCFDVTLRLDGKDVETTADVPKPEKYYENLMNGANYTVIVRTVSGHLRSPPLGNSKFTLPRPPTDVQVVSCCKDRLTFNWTAPNSTKTTTHLVNISSSFWNYKKSETVVGKTEHTFENLTSGTRFLIQVQTVADTMRSSPADISHCTEADEREISLSMLCSSVEPLHCAETSTKESVFSQLEAHFENLLGDHVFWKLEKQESENTIS
ncbi:receptor-type tyrosine-protein phosphatase H-like [Platichthys flesus]|uniref:receptor-type tyrosine-protein phosphatase H-like n=1 Tax=Platichthys flesus TaxID=8260 RepID=UPI002DB7810D|nr:receptor-type tyrosine-protein phosphatase H-like [Platichthys flesus]